MERRAPGACLISNSCVSITFSSSNVGLVMCDAALDLVKKKAYSRQSGAKNGTVYPPLQN